MLETEDPYKAMASKEVREQAAGARDLARIGTWDDMTLLTDKAISNRSAAVRLYASAAAADIVHRVRLAGEIDAARQDQLMQWVSKADADFSAGLLMLLSGVDSPRALQRIGRLLRDPRNGVRAGAAAALRRTALSRLATERVALSEHVGEWLVHPKLTPDAAYDLIHIVGEVGWADLGDTLNRHRGLSARHAEAIDLARDRLDARLTLDGWAGLFRDEGVDVFELPTADTPSDWPWLAWSRANVRKLDGKAASGGIGVFKKSPARLVWAPPLGAPDLRLRVIQTADRCFWEVPRDALQAILTTDPEQLPEMPAQMPNPFDAIDGKVPDKVHALWAWRAGDLETARARLDELTSKGRPQHALYYWLACVAEDQGDAEAACLAAGSYLDKAKAKAPFRERAQRLLERRSSHS